MNSEEKAKQWARIVAKAQADEDFKKRLLADPTSVLRAEGVEIPAGIAFKVVENTDTTMNLVLPAIPKSVNEMQDMEQRVAAQSCGY